MGCRYFERLLSSQGGLAFRQVRSGDAVQTAFASGRTGWCRTDGFFHLPSCVSGDGYLSSTEREPSRKLERDFLQGHVVVGKGEMALD